MDKQNTARLMYMAGDSTQRSIAKALHVSERTVYTWIKTEGWDRLRQAARQAPAVIAENIFSQIVELQNDIASREEGKRYPTMQEAELTRKLVLSVDRMKSAPALSQTMQVLRMFRSFANGYGDSKFRLLLNQVIEHFVEGEAKDGYMPYQVEYGPAIPQEPELLEEPELPQQPQTIGCEELRGGFSAAGEQSGDNSAPSRSSATSESTEKVSEVNLQKSAETLVGNGFESTSDIKMPPEKVGSVSEVSPYSLPPSLMNAFSRSKVG